MTATVLHAQVPTSTVRAEITYVCQRGVPNSIAVYDDPFTGYIGVDSQEEPAEMFCFPPMTQGYLSGCGNKPYGRGGQPIVFDIDPVDSDRIYRFAESSGDFSNCTFTTVIHDGTLPPITITNTVSAPNLSGDEVFASHRPAPRMPPTVVQFDASTPDDGKILISKALWDIGYPSASQLSSSSAGRAEIRISGSRRDAVTGQPRAGLVYLRVEDPPDSAAYRAANARDGDNDGAPATINGAASAAIQTDAQGKFEATLVATSQVAGDNYRVVGSADLNFKCGTPCLRTRPFTLWKRIYVEEQHMFRRGAFLNNPAETGKNRIPIDDPAPFQGLAPGEVLQLVHAESGLGEGFYFDLVRFDSLQQQPNGQWFITTAPGSLIPRDYGGTSSSTPNAILDVIRDGVGVVSAGTYEATGSYTPDLFTSMFVELKPVAGAVTEVPLVVQLKAPLLNTFFASRWLQQGVRVSQFGSRPDPNVVHRIAATQAPLVSIPGKCSGAQLGVTSVGGGGNYSYILSKRIEDVATGQAADPIPGCPPVGGEYLSAPVSRINGEVTAHETIHFWVRSARQPDMDVEGHCMMNRYTDATRCLMHTPYAGPELYDGQVLLHYEMHGAHSEYMWIRRDPDPVPQQ
jgi:hypothetical protein